MNSLFVPFIVAGICFLIYKTDFFVQYITLFGLGNKIGIREFKIHSIGQVGEKTNYFQYLSQKYPESFWAGLIGCPFCLGFWICLFLTYPGAIHLICFTFFVIVYKLMIL